METLYEDTGVLAIDLANTLELRRDGTTVDLLADQDGLARWLRHAGGPGGSGGRSVRSEVSVSALRVYGITNASQWSFASTSSSSRGSTSSSGRGSSTR
jgi:hypothetical protein